MADAKRILVTGGAGFVGGNVAVALAGLHPDWTVVALDNLRRRGSELNLPRLEEAGVEFVRGDVREAEDLDALDKIDALVECSADPSVLAGIGESPRYVVETNLLGAHNCLELARRDSAQLLFLSTSRVYPLGALNAVHYVETDTRFELSDDQELPGVSSTGISEQFPLAGARTMYGATKLAAELLITEYEAAYGVPTVIDRCGVIAGPWQMGKAEQGVFSHWLLSHYFKRDLSYIGFGGTGKQVRDVLHVDDLVELLVDQLERPEYWAGTTVNVGGGRACSLSLLETTKLCAEITGNMLHVQSNPEQRPGDVPVYVSDTTALESLTDWRPQRGAREILESMCAWVADNEARLGAALGLA